MKKDNMIRSGKEDSQYCDCKDITCGYNHSRTCVVNGTGNTPNAGRRCEGYTFEILECFSRLFPMTLRLLAIANMKKKKEKASKMKRASKKPLSSNVTLCGESILRQTQAFAREFQKRTGRITDD
ncbi:MAG: hypothetical protein HFG39_10575 [Lachnospiraceae bacterium]|nr:hypothetical protein [Lachnospiraceae bacterium]